MPTKWTFAQNCVFLGYSSSHRGYKCLHVPSGRLYISRHVIFDENLFPYASNIFFSRCWIGCPSYTCAHIYFSLTISSVFITSGVPSSFTCFSPLCPTTSISASHVSHSPSPHAHSPTSPSPSSSLQLPEAEQTTSTIGMVPSSHPSPPPPPHTPHGHSTTTQYH